VQQEGGGCAGASASLDFVGPYCLSGELFGIFLRVRGVLVCLSGQFMSGEMISFAVSGGGGHVGVGRKVVKFCGSIVRALWQCVPLPMVGLKPAQEYNGAG
jgi:hypothetical protein